MRICHIASLHSAKDNPGVGQQMDWESLSGSANDIDWTTELWTSDRVSEYKAHRVLPWWARTFVMRRLHLHMAVRSAASDHDAVLLRYAPLDLFAPLLPRRVRRKLFVVFHSKNDTYFQAQGRKFTRLLSWLDRWIGSRLTRNIAGLVAVTPEIASYESERMNVGHLPKLIYPNGVGLRRLAAPRESERANVQIAFIASHFFPYNGLGELLSTLHEVSEDDSWLLHIVGRVPDDLRVRAQAHRNVRFHGRLCSKRISELLDTIDLTLGAFRLDTVAISEACTLKVRESLGSGIAVYSGHRDSGLPSGFPYYRYGPPSMRAIVEHARRARHFNRNEVAAAARLHIDKGVLVRRLRDGIAAIYSKGRN